MITMSSFKYAGLIISIIISLISCTHNKNYPTAFGSPDKPGGLSIQLCKSEKKEFYIRYSS